MKLIVQKFGGSSISNIDRIIKISNIITGEYDKKTNVIVVVSAQGNTTNNLINKMLKVNCKPPKREMDVLLSVGEQISIALLASYIRSLGYEVISLTGWQAGIYTDGIHQNARIRYIDNSRILSELAKRKIVIVAGFQGVDIDNNITTLGRGGSDTSAVALAISLKADICQIYTDVDGIYTADPRLVKMAKKIDEITFDEMLEMSSLGAQILHNRSVELAKEYNVEIDVISSFSCKPGTRVKEEIKLEKNLVRGITCDNNILLITIKDDLSKMNDKYNILSDLESNNITVSGVALARVYGRDDFCFIVSRDQRYEVEKLLDVRDIKYVNNISRVSIVGLGLISNNSILSKLFKILSINNIEPYLILTSEISISMVVDDEIATKLMNILHKEYKLGDEK